MTYERIDRGQVWIYLAAIGVGLLLGWRSPLAATVAEPLIWPLLGLLLYVTFLQVPLTSLRVSIRDRRFLAAVLVGNFVVVPMLVWGITTLIPLQPAVLLGVVLVLLVPCSDWYITFTHLAGGDTGKAITVTPLNLLIQLGLLPLYLWCFVGDTFVDIVVVRSVGAVFLTLIVAPLLAAYLTERLAGPRGTLGAVRDRTRMLPVPLLSLVVFLIATSQVGEVTAALPLLPTLTAVFAVFMAMAVTAGWLLARGLRLSPPAARATVFSLATRNSFVVLPLALALAEPWHAAVVVIVYQSLIELLSLVILVRLVPRLLPSPATSGPQVVRVDR